MNTLQAALVRASNALSGKTLEAIDRGNGKWELVFLFADKTKLRIEFEGIPLRIIRQKGQDFLEIYRF